MIDSDFLAGKEIPYERTLPDGTVERGTLRLMSDSESAEAVELRALRRLAAAIEAYQMQNKYIAGSFKPVYDALIEWKSIRA